MSIYTKLYSERQQLVKNIENVEKRLEMYYKLKHHLDNQIQRHVLDTNYAKDINPSTHPTHQNT